MIKGMNHTSTSPVLFAKQFLLVLFCNLLIIRASDAQEISDPLEGFNRGIFWFNDQLDIYILEPVAQGYDHVTPMPVQKGVSNFFENLRYPKYLFNDVMQGKFTQAVEHTGRFLLNSTVGILGLIDVAKEFGMPKHEEDFGITLAYYGVGPGPYLVLPLLGPSNFRDGTGRIVDSFLDPFAILSYTSVGSDITVPVIIGAKVLEAIDTRVSLLDAVETAKESSVDYYLFVQSAYYQHRRGILYDGNPPDDDIDYDDFDDNEADSLAE